MKKIVLLFIALTVCALARAELSIKGIEVDLPANCQHINSLETRKGTFADPCTAKNINWMSRISFLNGQSDLFITQTKEGIIQSVLLSNFDFDLALTSLEAKYGKPETLNSVIQNRMGAKFDQTEVIWRDGEKKLSLSKHGIEIGKSVLILTGTESANALKNKNKPSTNL